jgi:hypothetical protein
MRRGASLFAHLVLAGAAACGAVSPAPRGFEQACAVACARSARGGAARCSDPQCARGCNLVLDRLVENEGGHVLACVETSSSCDDRTWAACATRIGVHADGGPPAPPPPNDNIEEP